MRGAWSGRAQTTANIGDAIAGVPAFLVGWWDGFEAGYAENAGKVRAMVGIFQNAKPALDAKLAILLWVKLAWPSANEKPTMNGGRDSILD
jgi:hypothetical protein